MRIKSIVSLEKQPINTHGIFNQSDFSALELNKEYTVYACREYYGVLCFSICDADYTYHPTWLPMNAFEITDSRLSRYWVFGLKPEEEKQRMFLGFPEWVMQLDFYDCLVDGDAREVRIFQQYKELMDLEFPDASVVQSAKIGDSEWLLCDICIDAWKSNDWRNALVKCPLCQTVYQNPRYLVHSVYRVD